MPTVGVPRALHYYRYFPMCKTFFEDLGFKVITSGATNREAIEPGTKRLVSDTCIPVKAYVGHVCTLIDRCDLVFVPVLRSLEPHVYNCSRFLGLPDLVRVSVPEIKRVIDIDIDIKRGEKDLKKRLMQFGRSIQVETDRLQPAVDKARAVHTRYLEILQKNLLTYQEGIDFLFSNKPRVANVCAPDGITIGIIGHPYVVNDEYLNHNLIQRLRKLGVRVITPEMVAESDLQKGIEEIGSQSYWTSESDVVGAAGAYFNNNLDGIIGITAFSCGPDSLMMSLVQHHAGTRNSAPFMVLTIDEHSSETGLLTRLEAFLEMIHRRKRISKRCV